MKTLLTTKFPGGKWPDDWQVSSAKTSPLAEGIHVHDSVEFQFLLPEAAGEHARLEIDLEPLGSVYVDCHNADILVGLNVAGFKCPRHVVAKNFQHLLGEATTPVPEKRGRCTVTVAFAGKRLAGEVDGEVLVEAADPHPRAMSHYLNVILGGPLILRGLRVLGTGAKSPRTPPVPTPEQEFFLEQAVDFHGFMCAAPFTTRTYDRMFAEFASWGVRRVHWIHYGSRVEGLWEASGWGTEANAARTFEQAGDIMEAATRAAHAHGIEIYGMLKPFDMVTAKFVREHPEYLLARKPGAWGPPTQDAVARIDLVKEDARAAEIGVGDLKLYVSDDNASYRPYEGAIQRSEGIEEIPLLVPSPSGPRPTGDPRRCRVLRLAGLEIRNTYVAIAVGGRAGSFSNRRGNLLRVFGPGGEETRLTYGFVPMRPFGRAAKGFASDGVRFDCTGDTPSSTFPGYRPLEWSCALDGRHGFVAFERGKAPTTLGAPSPAFPEVRQWWLGLARQVLDAGADGVEIRVRNHHDHLAWEEYGFEGPVRDEFLRRHGMDLWKTDEFDWAALRRLRGEFFTQFLRETKVLARQYGRKLGLHVSISEDMEPEQGAAMEVHWDWRRWIEEGLPDSITMKEVWPGSAFADEILAMTRPRGIPAIHSPYNHNITPSALPLQFRNAREAGYAGWQQYNPLFRGLPDGTLVDLNSDWIAVLRRHFA